MALPLVAAGAALAGGLAKTIIGASRASKAKRAMDNFQRQELTNIAQGLRVSTLGAELQTQEAQRRFATSVDALRSGGIRGLVGGLGRQEQLQQAQQQQIAAGLDAQQVQIDQMRAQDQARIRAMQEERESFDFQMLAGQRAAGQQALMSGIGDIGGAIGFAAMNMGKNPTGSSASTYNKSYNISTPGPRPSNFQFAGQSSIMDFGKDLPMGPILGTAFGKQYGNPFFGKQ